MNNNEEDETTIHRQVVEDRDDDAYLMRVPIIITTLTVGTFHLPTCLCTLDSYESVGCFCIMQSGCWGFALLVLNPQVLAPQQHHSVGVLLVSFVSSCIHIQRRSQSRAHLGPVFDLGPSYLLKISYLWLWSHRQTSFEIATWNQVRKKEDTWRSS